MFCQGDIEEMGENLSETVSRRWRKPKQARSVERVNRILDVAEVLFIEKGYATTTTREIATQAEIPIGSLYQFFPDKAAILQALAERYSDLLNQRLQSFDTPEMTQISLPDYVKRLVKGIEQFFVDYPGYRAIFMEIAVVMPEIDEAGDAQLIQTFATLLSRLNLSLSPEDYNAIAFVMVKAMGNLLWMSLGQKPHFRQRLVTETERLTLSYLQSYFGNFLD